MDANVYIRRGEKLMYTLEHILQIVSSEDTRYWIKLAVRGGSAEVTGK